jgi:hypothetical protein
LDQPAGSFPVSKSAPATEVVSLPAGGKGLLLMHLKPARSGVTVVAVVAVAPVASACTEDHCSSWKAAIVQAK